MASIKPTTSTVGGPRFTVYYKNEKTGHGRHRSFLTIDDAAFFFWKRESIELDTRTADWGGADRAWTFQKLLYFFLGHQQNKVERNQIRLSSYQQCRRDILAIDGEILNKSILRISNRDIEAAIKPGCIRWIRSAFHLMTEKRLIIFNPIEKATRRKRRPITIPSKSAVRQLLNTAPRRERIAVWFGICGMRIGEALAITYTDVSHDWINIRRHIVDGVICEGLKRGVERRVRMPRELFSLLDERRIGTSDPVIGNMFNGQPMAISYATQGQLQKVLLAHGITKYHHLRHFAVSRLAEKGVDILKVSRLIGHSSIKTTMDVYGHLFGEAVDMDLE